MVKTVLVTGGAGALGGSLVRRFRSENWNVAFTYRRGEEAAKKLQDETGAMGVYADLTRSGEAHAAIDAVMAQYERIDALVNAAGSTQVMPFVLIEDDDWDDVIASNLKTMFVATKEVVRWMIHARTGSIVNIGSIAGQRLLDVPIHYATAKAGVCGFTVALAAELRRWNIRVNCVIPGLLEGGVAGNVPQNERDEYLKHCMAGRPGRMDEVAELVLFLADDRSSYINAQSICVDGGI